MNVLLIEPNIVLSRTYSAALSEVGHSVMAAQSAQSAIHASDEQIPDCIILELQLSSHSGVEFLYELRSYTEWRDIPVIVHSLVPPESLALTSDKKQQLGIAEYLYKPATRLSKLTAAVEESRGF